MDPKEILLIVDTIHRERNIDKEIVFEGIEAAMVSAARKHYGEDEDIVISIDRTNGLISGTHNGTPLSPTEMAERIGAQSAKQVMIQKIREAERDALYNEYNALRGQMVTGTVQRVSSRDRRRDSGKGDGDDEARSGTAFVSLGNMEAILPPGEQLRGDRFRVNDRVRASIYEVRKKGSRVRVILSRLTSNLVQALFEEEIPEIADGVIEIKAVARQPGERSKVAVYSSDQRVDCVGACVGIRGSRIKNIVQEMGDERIDIVEYDPDMQIFIPNALKPAEVEEVILCQMLGRAIVLVQPEQKGPAIGKYGQNVQLASLLVGWDIDIKTRDMLDEQLENAVMGFSSIEGVTEELAEMLVGEGFLTFDDLAIIEPDALMAMGNLTEEQVDDIVYQADVLANEAEKAEQESAQAEKEARRQRESEARQAALEENAEESEPNEESDDASESEENADNPGTTVDNETQTGDTVSESTDEEESTDPESQSDSDEKPEES